VPYRDGDETRSRHYGAMAQDDDQWAVIHCYATYEDLVIEKIKQRVPDAEVRRLGFPGCIAYRWDPDRWDDVRNAGGVTGFVGEPGKPKLHRSLELG
jgi:transcription antitermination factor NusG